MVPNEVILSGGNFGTISFLGAIQSLIEKKQFDIKSVKKWICTSGGSVIALLLIIGYSPKRIMDIAYQIPFDKVSPMKSDKWLGLFDKYGLHDTNTFKKIFELMLENINFPVTTTFEELYKKNNVDLNFTSYCINSQSLVLLNYKNTPDLKLLNAVCMSIAVPFLFFPVKYKNEYYIDAFLVSIHPVEYCTNEKECNSISFCLESNKDYIDNIDLLNYIRIIVNSPISKLQDTFLNNYKGKNITIKCNYKFNATFELTNDTLKSFYNDGYNTIK